MDVTDIPQDAENFYEGHKRAVYARAEDGHYVMAQSRGWSVETFFTAQAVGDIEERARQVAVAVRAGRASPLEYHMLAKMMTPQTLAQSCQLFVWRVKRHLRPSAYAALSLRVKEKYARALGMTVTELDQLPEVAP